MLGIIVGVTVSASAEPILRVVTFTAADPSKQDQIFQVVSDVNTMFVAAKGFQWSNSRMTLRWVRTWA
jgi:hypothetical protein